jgi:periplasmic protein CpxP/Spy
MRMIKSILAIAFMITIATQAQAQQPANPKMKDSVGFKHNKHPHRGEGKAQMKGAMKELNLSAEQKEKVKELRKANQENVQRLRADSTMAKADRRAAMQKMKAENKAKMQQVLSQEQMQKLDSIKAQRHSRKGKKAAPAQSQQ